VSVSVNSENVGIEDGEMKEMKIWALGNTDG
jgi:hypothetical protein